jgi:hypothetical protein
VQGIDAGGLIHFAPPQEWAPCVVARPELAKGGGVSVDAWSAWSDPNAAAHAVHGCLGTDLGTWTDELGPFALERVAATMSTVATKLTGTTSLRAETVQHLGNVTTQSFASAGDDAHVVGRTFLGFASTPRGPRIEGCFILCAPTTPTCDEALDAATPNAAFVPAPATSPPLRALVFGVHHPLAVAITLLSALCVLGVVAIVTRRRPRTK